MTSPKKIKATTKDTSKKSSTTSKVVSSSKKLTAKSFIEELKSHQSDKELEKIQRYFKSEEGQYGHGDTFIGVRMGTLFELAKQNGGMPVAEIEKLLESKIHEARAGALSIMDKASRDKKITEERLKEFFDVCIKRTDRINNWDLVDLCALNLIGRYLIDKKRDMLYKLARSKDIWERRIAIVGTTYFIRQGQVDDTFKIAEMLVQDKEDLVHKGTGWMLRFCRR